MITFFNRWYWQRKFGPGFSDQRLDQLRAIYRNTHPGALVLTINNQRGIRCMRCEITSYHPMDIEHLYCGKCHRFLESVIEVLPKEK